MPPPHPAAPPRGKIYLQFEAWNENTNAFETLPQGVPVKLMHYNAILSNDVLDTQNTDAQGCVEFPTEDLASKNKGNPPNIFYLAQTKGITIGGQKLPDEWSTKGWKSRDGQPGYWKEFVGNRLGDVGSPQVFRIGLDFHVRWTYERPGRPDEAATRGIPVAIVTSERKKRYRRLTDDKGEMHGVIFDVSPEEDIWFNVQFQIADPPINLPKVNVNGSKEWDTNDQDADKLLFTKYAQTSIATKAVPHVIKATTNERNVAFYFLKIAREWATFFYYITDHAWTGLKEIQMNTSCVSGAKNAFSWPIGEINIGSNHHWERGTLIHELSHQVMWKEAAISSAGVVGQVVKCNLALIHYQSLLSNPVHALIEGWAEFIEAVFVRRVPYSVTDVIDGSSNVVGPLGPPPLNRGESVEGAFASGLWDMFRHYVVGDPTKVPIPETANGDLKSIATWIDTGEIKDRFKAMIWDPLRDLPFQANKDTVAFIAKMRSMHPAGWHSLVGHLQRYNLAMVPPTLTGLHPAAGPVAGGQEATVTGTNFVVGTQLKIGGTSVAVTVESSTKLKFRIPPGRPGDAELEVSTPSGSEKLVYRYLP